MGLLSVSCFQSDSFYSYSLSARCFRDHGIDESVSNTQNASDIDVSGFVFSGGGGGVFTIFVSG